MNYYSENDPKAAATLRKLIEEGHISEGVVDERSIEDVVPDELAGYNQVHLFAGFGLWSLAFRWAGIADDTPAWSCSCPCQPFSAAGKGAAFTDERHLWPAAFHLIQHAKRPGVPIYGEQVAGARVMPWIDLVWSDLEAAGHTFRAFVLASAGFGAPIIRQRLFWVASAKSSEWRPEQQIDGEAHRRNGFGGSGDFGGVELTAGARSLPGPFAGIHSREKSSGPRNAEPGSVLICFAALCCLSVLLWPLRAEAGRVKNRPVRRLPYPTESKIVNQTFAGHGFIPEPVLVSDTAIRTKERQLVLQATKLRFRQNPGIQGNRLVVLITRRRNRSAESGQLAIVRGRWVKLWSRRNSTRLGWKYKALISLTRYADWSVSIDSYLVDDAWSNSGVRIPQWRWRIADAFDQYPTSVSIHLSPSAQERRSSRLSRSSYGSRSIDNSSNPYSYQEEVREIIRRNQFTEITLRIVFGPLFLLFGNILIYHGDSYGYAGWDRARRRIATAFGCIICGAGLCCFLLPVYWQEGIKHDAHPKLLFHSEKNVPQKRLTTSTYCTTVIT